MNWFLPLSMPCGHSTPPGPPAWLLARRHHLKPKLLCDSEVWPTCPRHFLVLFLPCWVHRFMWAAGPWIRLKCCWAAHSWEKKYWSQKALELNCHLIGRWFLAVPTSPKLHVTPFIAVSLAVALCLSWSLTLTGANEWEGSIPSQKRAPEQSDGRNHTTGFLCYTAARDAPPFLPS